MKTSLSHRKRGVALIIVLSLVVLVTAVVIAFFSRAELNRKISAVSGGGVQADAIAKSAVDVIIGDLRSEIVHGSDESGDLYIPRTSAAVYPQRVPNNNVPSLLKVSMDAPFYSGAGVYTEEGPARGSGVTTERASANHRYFTRSRWLAARLVPEENRADFPLPQWAYVTQLGDFGGYNSIDDLKVGGNRPAVGRFAFAVYDVGGLLDINAAGNQLATGNQHRGRLHHANLTQFGTGQSAINTFLSERNPESEKPTVDSEAEGSGGIFDPLRDFVKINTVGAEKEQIFLTRQHLIEYATNGGAINPAMLPHLTIFSREKNAPIWNTDSEDNANFPDLPLSVTTRLKERFPLSRIKLLSSDDSDTAGNITAFFGLIRSENGKYWRYAAPTGSEGRIRTITEVVNAGEQPNFFELLKSLIGNRTLLGNLPSSTIGGHPHTALTDDPLKQDAHIFQIGANIIDWYDSDDFPTDIFVNFANDNLEAAENRIFGVEDLPYISRVAANFHWVAAAPPTQPDPKIEAYLIPELYNPFGPIKPSPTRPRPKVQIRAIGSATLGVPGLPGTPFQEPSYTQTGGGGTGTFVAPSRLSIETDFDIATVGAADRSVWIGNAVDTTAKFDDAAAPGLFKAGEADIPASSTPSEYTVEAGDGAGGGQLAFILEYNAAKSQTDPDDFRPYSIFYVQPGTNSRMTVSANPTTKEPILSATDRPLWRKIDDVRTARARVVLEAAPSSGTNSNMNVTVAPTLATEQILNRSFRGVGEFGYVFRDEPNVNIRLSEKDSPDAALLEFFSVTDSSASGDKVIGGRLSLSSRSLPALNAMLSGAAKSVDDSTGLADTEAEAAANIAIAATDPITSRAELINLFAPEANGKAAIRALAEVANTRTWNLMIDVVAQAGRIPSSATGSASDRFIVEGERRYWIHVAIDRYTGQEIGSRIVEVVKE